jgi:phosphoglycolate phosphatase-like HAD superfamily hydrolase
MVLLLMLGAPFGAAAAESADPLASWVDGATRTSILSFLDRATSAGSTDYVPVAERVAVFDNDGTLWSEQPIYFQLIYVMDQVKALASEHPEWKSQQPFASVLSGDPSKALVGGKAALLEMLAATHGGMTTEAFADSVADWVRTARHPTTGRPYTQMVYQPMLELLELLRANGFKTYIVSGGGVDFMRAFAEAVYGIPPEQVIGSSMASRYEVQANGPAIVKLPQVGFIDDKEGKPIAIHQHIGRRPVFAAGNSDGDLQMLEWTTAGDGPRFGLIVHHTDAEREWAYDRESHIGRLDAALDLAGERNWLLVDIKRDWRSIYPD